MGSLIPSSESVNVTLHFCEVSSDNIQLNNIQLNNISNDEVILVKSGENFEFTAPSFSNMSFSSATI